MTDRVVSYEFKGRFNNLTAGLAAAGKSVGDLSDKLTAADKNGAKMRKNLSTLGDTAGKFGLGAAAGLGAIVVASARFDKSMSAVQAATHETADNMELLRAAAIKAGADTAYSATEAAGAIEELSKAGVSTRDILGGGLSGALNLAAAGGLEVADAAEIAASALTQFQLSGKDVPHVADLLAAGAGKAQGSVQDLGYALKYAGVPANALGVSIEETTGTLAEFASAGIVGEQAGTTLRSMLLSLSAPTNQAQKVMDAYGLSLYDASGQFVGMQAAAQQLHDKLGPLTEAERNHALSVIFGQTAIQGAITLYQGGGKAVEQWTNNVNDAGYAAETAATRMDNLAGDVEQFKGSLETALIGAGEGSQGVLRGIVQDATKAVNAFNGLPPAAQSSATALLAVGAVTGGSLWLGSAVVNKIAATRTALAELNATAAVSRATMAGIGAGVSFAAIAGGVWAVDKALDAAFGSRDVDVQNLNRNLTALAGGDALGNLDKMGGYLVDINSSFEHATANAFGWVPFDDPEWKIAEENINQVDEALAGLVESGHADQAAAAMDQITKMAGEQGISTEEATKWFDQYRTALSNVGDASTETASTNEQYATTTTDASMAASDAAQSIEALAKAMQDQRRDTLSAFDAETQYRQAMKDAKAQADKNSAGIKGNSEAALGNRSALSSLAAAWNNQSEAVKNNTAKFREAKANFIQTATAMGVPRQAAIALAKSLLEIPKSRVVNVVAQTDSAFAHLRALKAELKSIQDEDVYVNYHIRRPSASGMGPQLTGSAAGGTVTRPSAPAASLPAHLAERVPA